MPFLVALTVGIARPIFGEVKPAFEVVSIREMGATGMTPWPLHRNWRYHGMCLVILGILLAWTGETRGQDATGSGTPSTPATSSKTSADQPAGKQTSANESKPEAELSSRDTGTTFKLRVNLVQVHVVVRDAKGELVPGLTKQDFEVYDQGKLQAITTFAVETVDTRKKRTEDAAKTQETTESAGEKIALPERFVALVFDDIHLSLQDATFVRVSAKKLIDGMTPTERIGIFGTSEQVSLEYTNDKALLERTRNQIVPRPKMGKVNDTTNCPDVTHYMADQSINKSDPMVLPVVAQETLQCMFNGDPNMLRQAQMMAASALQQELVAGDTDNEFTYRALEDVIRRLASMPGERVLVLASPGFLLSTQYLEEMGIIDRANRANVVINTVDARGLYTPDVLPDVSQRITDTPQTAALKTQYRTQAQFDDAFVLSDFANGTGGTFFQNSNDVAGGLAKAGLTPEVSYILGFSPQNQRMDGKYHAIKVVITDKRKYNIQARRGYYAPRKVDDPKEQARQEIQEAVFSQDEIQELPLDFQTQYFKTGLASVHLSVVSKIDPKGIHFRKADGRSYDDLTIATVVFDENGNFVMGGEKILEMRLLDKTYDRLSRTGLVMKSSFDLKPGKYIVRQVVRDSEGAHMAAKSGAVVIPY
jgi:VWFA-related protein